MLFHYSSMDDFMGHIQSIMVLQQSVAKDQVHKEINITNPLGAAICPITFFFNSNQDRGVCVRISLKAFAPNKSGKLPMLRIQCKCACRFTLVESL